MNDSLSTEHERRRFQFGLKTLLLLAIPTALVALFLKAWLPWLNPPPKDVDPSAFLAPLELNQLESMFRGLVPKGTLCMTGSTGRGEASPRKGKWFRQLKAALVCDPADADRAMRSCRSDLHDAVRQHGGTIGEEQESLEESSLVGFRFDYVEADHSGMVEVTLGPKQPIGPFDHSPPLRRLTIQIKESTGYPPDEKIAFWEEDRAPQDNETLYFPWDGGERGRP
jgi:hypothetical protein